MTHSAPRPTGLHGQFLMRAMALAAVVGLAIGIYVGIEYVL